MLQINGTGDRMINIGGGRTVPEKSLRAHVLLTHDTAEELVGEAVAYQAETIARKRAFYDKVDAYVALMFEHYRANVGGRRGGTVIANLSDTMKVHVSVSDYQRITAALPAAQSLINQILDDITQGANADLRAMVSNAFARDRGGRVNIDSVLGLRKLNLAHPKWPDAVAAINDSVEISGSRSYIRFYQRENEEAAWRQIDLNFSSLEVGR